MLVCWPLLNDLTYRQQMLGQSLSDVGELIVLKLLQGWDNTRNEYLWIEEFAKVTQSTNSSCPHLWLWIFEELAIIRCQVLLGVLDTDAICYFHNLIGNKVSDSPALVNGELLNIWHQVLLNLSFWEGLGEVNATVDALHSNWILLILVELAEDVEEILVWNQWNKLYHIVQYKWCTLPNLWYLILRSLGE